MLPQHTFLLQGVDVIVNASSVEDIDAGAIGQRLSNGLARLSSPVLHRLRLREDENAEPVVSVCLGPAGLAQGSACPHPLSLQTCSLSSCHAIWFCRAPPTRKLMQLWK